MADPTEQEVAAIDARIGLERKVYNRINAMFARVDTRGNTAYCTLQISADGMLELEVDCPADGFPVRVGWENVHSYPYRALRDGQWFDNGFQRLQPPIDHRTAVKHSIRAIELAWPHHAKLQLVWRCPPEIDDRGALYMRLVATPVV